MIYTIEMHPELPALIATWDESFVYSRDGITYSEEMREHLNQLSNPMYYVLDLSAWHDMTFEELSIAASVAARQPNANFHHAMNRGNMIITSDPTVRASAEGLQSDIYGNADTRVFTSIDDAFTYIASNS